MSGKLRAIDLLGGSEIPDDDSCCLVGVPHWPPHWPRMGKVLDVLTETWHLDGPDTLKNTT